MSQTESGTGQGPDVVPGTGHLRDALSAAGAFEDRDSGAVIWKGLCCVIDALRAVPGKRQVALGYAPEEGKLDVLAILEDRFDRSTSDIHGRRAAADPIPEVLRQSVSAYQVSGRRVVTHLVYERDVPITTDDGVSRVLHAFVPRSNFIIQTNL